MLTLPTLNEVLTRVVTVASTRTFDLGVDKTAYLFIDVLEDLFPGCRFAVRLVDKGSEAWRHVYAKEPLRRDSHSNLTLSEQSVALCKQHGPDIARSTCTTTPTYQCIFEGTQAGFDVPLVHANTLFGVLCVEHADPTTLNASQVYPLVAPVALQLGASLRQAELITELNNAKDRLARLIRHADSPILVMHDDGRIDSCNEAFSHLVALSPEQLVGRAATSFVDSSDRPAFRAAFERALNKHRQVEVEVLVARGPERTARVSWSFAPVPEPETGSGIESVIAIGRDMSKVRQLEKQMVHAEKLATLGQLAAGIVHELNNPLTSISAYAEYLLKVGRKRSAPQEDLRKLERIIESSDRIARFARDLMAYARPSTDKPQPLRVEDVIEQAVVFCEHVLARDNVAVVRAYSDNSVKALAIQDQLQQVFINLITNACHALQGRPSPRLTFETAWRSDEGFIVHVRDNGAGIAREHLSEIFEPFFSTKQESQGTGLGLSIVRNIIEQHGGAIACDSVLDEGTVFTICLPVDAG